MKRAVARKHQWRPYDLRDEDKEEQMKTRKKYKKLKKKKKSIFRENGCKCSSILCLGC